MVFDSLTACQQYAFPRPQSFLEVRGITDFGAEGIDAITYMTAHALAGALATGTTSAIAARLAVDASIEAFRLIHEELDKATCVTQSSVDK